MAWNIQYATTTDGVSIAFTTIGQGPPLVVMPWGPWANIEVAQLPGFRVSVEKLAESAMLVVYDSQGTGLSARPTKGFGVDAQVGDLEAVVDHLELERFALMGSQASGPASIAFSVDNPDRVAHLVLWASFANGHDFVNSAYIETYRALIDRDWTFFTEAGARRALGWSHEEIARQLAKVLRESSSSDTVKKALVDIGRIDVTSILSEVRTPTLVLQPHDLPYPDLAAARLIATRVHEARVVLVEGEVFWPFIEGYKATVEFIESFLATPGGPLKSHTEPESALQGLRGLLTERVGGT